MLSLLSASYAVSRYFSTSHSGGGSGVAQRHVAQMAVERDLVEEQIQLGLGVVRRRILRLADADLEAAKPQLVVQQPRHGADGLA